MQCVIACFVAAIATGNPDAAPDRGLDGLDFRAVIRDATERVFPALVFIKCLQETNEAGERKSQEVSGSGVLVSPRGEVLTNWHVVDKATRVRCLLSDGRAFEAKVRGSDKDVDLALVELALPADSPDLPHAPLGDSARLIEGDFVMAMGAPWGLSRSVSIGIVSCPKRYLPEQSEYSLWLQTDASISPGNSGGPLVNTAGEVVGINTLGTFGGGDIGFSIPSSLIQEVLPRMRLHGSINWSWTGIRLQAIRDFNKDTYFEGSEGVLVASTDEGSPSRRAGILERDRLLAIDGVPINGLTEEDLPAIRRRFGLLEPDKPVRIDLLRGGEKLSVEITPSAKGKVEGEELACPRWDLAFKTINQFDNPGLYFFRKEGVFVYGVKRPGNAAIAGLREDDIILKIDGKSVATLAEVETLHKEALGKVDANPRAVLTVLRNGLMRQVVLDFSRDYERE